MKRSHSQESGRALSPARLPHTRRARLALPRRVGADGLAWGSFSEGEPVTWNGRLRGEWDLVRVVDVRSLPDHSRLASQTANTTKRILLGQGAPDVQETR